MDYEVLGWVIAALKESHADSKQYHAVRMAILQTQYEKLQRRLDAMYEDKLDGQIDKHFYDRKSSEWKKEQEDILRKIERLQTANRSYLAEGVKLLELAQRAVFLYEKKQGRKSAESSISCVRTRSGRMDDSSRATANHLIF